MAEPAIRVIDTTHGEVLDPDENQVAAHIARLEGDLDNAERELRKARRKIKTLEEDKERDRQLYALRSTVELIFDEWRVVRRHPNSKLGGKRFDAVRDRVEEGYERAHFAMAVHGANAQHFVKDIGGGKSEHYDDIELICRTETNLERFANRAPAGVTPMTREQIDARLAELKAKRNE